MFVGTVPDVNDEAMRVVRALVEDVWNAGDLDALDSLFRDPFDHSGRMDTVEGLRDWHRADAAAWRGTHYEVVEAVSNGNTVAIRWRATARHVGVWGPVPASGREVTWEGAHFVTVEDGRICRMWALGDTFGKARQLGVRFESPSGPPDDAQPA